MRATEQQVLPDREALEETDTMAKWIIQEDAQAKSDPPSI